MNLSAQVLLALIAAAAAEAKEREDGLPGNFDTECTRQALDSRDLNNILLMARCGTGSDAVDMKLELNKCLKNDLGKIAWGIEYV